MKKSKALVLILTLALLVGTFFAVSVPAAAEIVEDDWVAAPKKTLVKCPGGECDHTACDYVYSFAVIGDTQNLNYRDAQNYTAALAENPTLTYADFTSAYMRVLYNWLLDNKEAKNIEYVLGMGDITQSFNVNQTYYDEEWPLAKEAISLLDGKLGYSLVRGNHDISSGMNAQFGVGSRYYNDLAALAATNDSEGRPMAGFLNTEKVEDTYRKIVTSTGDKYIIFTLDYYPTEACVDWVDEILAENLDYTAIITLHAFLNTDRTFLNEFETTTPADVTGQWVGTSTGGNVEPSALWEEALRKHENVKLIFSGHVTGYGYSSQLKGDNGNTVTAMLVDAQNIDNDAPIGMITMVYVSNDGSVVNVENFSPVRLAEGKNAYYMEENQFELTVDYGNAWTATKYGNIPSSVFEDKAYTFHVFLDDDADADNTNFYWSSHATWSETLTAIHEWNGKGGAAARSHKTYNIVMSQDYTFSDGIPSNKSGQFPGKFNLDFNGNTMTLSKNGVLVPFYNGYSGYVPVFTIQNGNVIMAGNSSSHLAVLQTSSAGETVIELNVKDLNVSYNGSASSLVGMYGGNASSKGSVNLNVSNCNIDTTGASGAVTLFALNDTNNNNNAALNITGGSIKGTTSANLTVYTLNTGDDTAKFSPDSLGSYTTVSLTENVAPVGIFRNEEGKLLNFVTESTEAPYVFTAAIAPIEETPYGAIPTDVYPAASYPFVLFQNGEIAAAYSTWYDFCQNIWSFDTSETKESVLYLRDDITVSKTSKQLRNVKSLTFDLGGNTLTAGVTLFDYMAEKDYAFTTNITVTNGTVTAAAAWAPIVAYNSANTKDVVCGFNTTFNGVTFNATSDFSGRLLAEAWKDGAYGTKNTLTFNGCTFDVTVGNVSKLFQLEESNSQNKVDVAININGGKLIANSYFTLATFSAERESGKGSPDTLTFGKDNSGNEFSLQMPSGVAHPTTGVVTTEGTLYPIETVDDGTNATYYFKSNVTKYGAINVSNLSAVNYPFVLFDESKNQIGAYAHWKDYVNAHLSGTLLMRRDYDTTETSGSTSLYQVENLILDLDGHVLSQSTGTANRLIFHAQRNGNVAFNANITVTNGTITMGRNYASVIVFESTKAATDDSVECKFNFTFNGVTFNTMDGYKGRPIVEAWTGNAAARGRTKNTVTFNDCTFDATNTNVSILFRLLEGDNTSKVSNNYHDVAVTVNGGKIIKGSQNLTLWSVTPDSMGGGDSLKYGQMNGEYVSFVYPKGSAAPTYNCEASNGAELEFTDVSTDKNAIYQLSELLEYNGYYIPSAYADVNTYPFVLFKNGKAIYAFSNWKTFIDTYIPANSEYAAGCTLILRTDFTTKNGNPQKLAYVKDLVIDLCGNKLTRAASNHLFNALGNLTDTTSQTTNITVKNGVLLTSCSNAIVAFNNGTNGARHKFNFTFDSVVFGRTSGATGKIAESFTSGTYGSDDTVTFNDCIFSFVNDEAYGTSAPTKKLDWFDLLDVPSGKTDGMNNITVIINGGEVRISNASYLSLGTMDTAGDSITFAKLVGGNYTKFSIPTGNAAPTIKVNNGELTFVKIADDGTTTSYMLMPAAAVNLNYAPKSSITLSNALIYNVYVPVNAVLKSFTLNGVAYTDLVALTDIVTIDANNYYHFAIELPSAEAAKDIVLEVVITVDGKDYNGKWTMSIPKYAAKVLANGTDVEKTLAKDVLAYVKAAYNYFTEFNTAEEITRINALVDSIIGDYKAEPVSSGVTNTVAPVTAVTLNLDAKPSIRFYVTDTTIEFFANGRKLDTVTGTDETYGAYVELDVYA
ncbi:MAG: hypothetical protein E7673_04350, partial [Ruminococcaceae bacterium]|nr:hypothetical protein [Oscillospiraceae bacterium]